LQNSNGLIIRCIPSFQRDIANLTERVKHGYASVRLDIRRKFSDLTYESFLNNFIQLHDTPEFRLFKIRLPNSGINSGTSGGFRLICLADKEKKQAVLLHVYPKKGKFGKESTSENELVRLIKEYALHKMNLPDWSEEEA
jgi:mRNA-degrading endonuclease RelE of RelBE toxin-antitoxin system